MYMQQVEVQIEFVTVLMLNYNMLTLVCYQWALISTVLLIELPWPYEATCLLHKDGVVSNQQYGPNPVICV